MSATTCTRRCLARDAWLGEVLGRAAYRFEFSPDAAASEMADELTGLEPSAFVYTKAACKDVARVGRLQELGFRLIDTNVVLEKPCGGAPAATPGALVRFAGAQDEEAVVRVARGSFTSSRFHLDPRIPAAAANAVKAEWARNFFHGKRGQHMVVALVDGEVAGFEQILHSGEALTIDLIAVEERFRRRGLAAAMIRFAESALPARTIRVGTQIANASSLRLYESLGFRVAASQYVFHLHRPER
jgi:ribosomal protein S18 acetylase RimI-like enzyme